MKECLPITCRDREIKIVDVSPKAALLKLYYTLKYTENLGKMQTDSVTLDQRLNL